MDVVLLSGSVWFVRQRIQIKLQQRNNNSSRVTPLLILNYELLYIYVSQCIKIFYVGGSVEYLF